MVLGIVSLVMLFTCGLGFVTAVIALVMAPGARREIAASGGRLTGESQVRTGTILSWVTLGLTALAVVALAVVIGVAISVDDGASSPAEPTVVSAAPSSTEPAMAANTTPRQAYHSAGRG